MNELVELAKKGTERFETKKLERLNEELEHEVRKKKITSTIFQQSGISLTKSKDLDKYAALGISP